MTGYGDLLTDPRAFFDRERENPSVLVPTLVVLLVGALSALAFWFSWQLLSEFIARAAEQGGGADTQGVMTMVQTIGAAAGIAFAVIGAFAAWLYYGVLFFGISALLDGEGDFKTTMLFTAWGFVPKLAELVVKVIGNWYLSVTVAVPQEINQGSSQAFQSQLAGNPVSVLLPIVGIIALLVCGYIWVGAMQSARRLDRREAIITVAVPVGLVLVSRFWNLVNTLGLL